ncbi:MAG: ferritin family protein [Bacteroidales bacterium]|nr:ferritin family protein [Bacteroidales bacterium]
MKSEKTIEILKTAILLERKGKAFYSHVASQANDSDVKEFFQMMADEEDEHVKFLTEQYENFTKNESFSKVEFKHEDHADDDILTQKVKQKIESASFESAAISSAIDMENRAIKVYSDRAETAETKEERDFYNWLANWERGHNKLLHEIDKALQDKVWNDNSFWPF